MGRHLVRLYPRDVTVEWSVPKRTGKIFMDYNMNVRGKTLNVAYSPRGEPGAPVSMPLTWEELAGAHPLDFTLANLGYRFPDYPVPDGETQISFLRRITEAGAHWRYRPLTEKARRQIARELDLIEKLDLAGYFLIVWDLVNYCRQQDILAQGRGSAANSAFSAPGTAQSWASAQRRASARIVGRIGSAGTGQTPVGTARANSHKAANACSSSVPGKAGS